MVIRRAVAVCVALAVFSAGAARTAAVRAAYGLATPPVRVVRPAAVRAHTDARTAGLRTVAVPVRDRADHGDPDREPHPGLPALTAAGRAPRRYLARTRDDSASMAWTTRARMVQGPGRRSRGGPSAAWVRVPAPYPARTRRGQAALWWYLPPAAKTGRSVDGARVTYTRACRQLPPPRRRRGRARPKSMRRPRHMSGEYGRIFRAVLAHRDGAACFYCRAPFADPATEATFDHYLPSALWRTRRHNAPWNLVLACQACNGAKGDVLPWPLVWLLLARLGGRERGVAPRAARRV